MYPQITKSSILLLPTILFMLVNFTCAVPSVIVPEHDILYDVNSIGKFSIKFRGNISYPVHVGFIYKPADGYNIIPMSEQLVNKNETPLWINTTAYRAGHTIVKVNVTSDTSSMKINTDEAFVRIGVYKFNSLNIISDVVGWLYFICWSISFYPQIIVNWKRKSVIGLNFDFLGLNLTGFIAYSIFNIGLRYVEEVKNEYHHVHPEGVIPVMTNDVVFAVHAAVATAVTIGQCFIYERGNQLISKMTVAALALVWSTAGVFLLITALRIIKDTPWLTFLYFFSYVKLLVTLTKYIPQVVYNYRRKSTSGWSIGTVLLDFVGGFFSITQMFIVSYNFNDWLSIFGNFTKFGLGVASITFDVIFMVQHYILYPKKKSDSRLNLVE